MAGIFQAERLCVSEGKVYVVETVYHGRENIDPIKRFRDEEKKHTGKRNSQVKNFRRQLKNTDSSLGKSASQIYKEHKSVIILKNNLSE